MVLMQFVLAGLLNFQAISEDAKGSTGRFRPSS